MTPKNVKGVKVTFIFLYIYIYKIKNKTAQTENNEEKKHFGKNTWSLHQHCVPFYIIITSVKSSM